MSRLSFQYKIESGLLFVERSYPDIFFKLWETITYHLLYPKFEDGKIFSIKNFRRFLRTTVPFVTAHLEIFHCTHHPVIPTSDLYFTFCSTLNALSKRTSK